MADTAPGDMPRADASFATLVVGVAESRARKRMMGSDLFPSEMHPDRETFERLGFTFGEAVDDLLVRCTLPEGWSRRPCPKPTHTYVVDGVGNVRVEVFLKEVPYERKADAALVARHAVLPVRGPGVFAGVALAEGERALAVLDRGVAVRVFGPAIPDVRPAGEPRRSPWDVRREAEAWLDAHHPAHADPVASWADLRGRA